MESATVTFPNGKTATITGPTKEAVMARVDILRADNQAEGGQQDLGTFFGKKIKPSQSRNFVGDIFAASPSIASSIAGEIGGGIAGIAGLGAGLVEGAANKIGGEGPGPFDSAAQRGAQFQESARDFVSFAPPDRTLESVTELGGMADDATQLARKPVAGITGLASLPFGVDQAAENVDSITTEGIGKFFGEPIAEATGSPALGAVVTTIPTAIATLLGVAGLKRVDPKIQALSDDVSRVAKERGINPNDARNSSELQNIIDEVTGPQLDRAETLRSVGIENPTRAQVTRSVDDFQRQQELSKTSGRVSDRLREQEGQLSQTFDNAVEATGGQKVTPGSTVIDEVVGRSTRLDDEISALYGKARDAAQGQPSVDMSGFVKKVLDNLDSDGATDGLFSALRGELRRRGVINETGEVVGRVDVATAEEIRKFVNAQFDPKNRAFANSQIRELKESLDTDVFRSAGRDIFNEARSAKSQFEQQLSAARISKFDKNRTSLVRDVLENKIDPGGLVEAITSTRRYRAKHLEELRDYLRQTESGAQAFDDLRAQVLQNIRDKAFIGPEDAAGIRALSRNRLEIELKKIGQSRLEVLFSAEEMGLLNRMLAAAKIREPVRGTALGLGPSGQVAKELAGNSMIARIFDLVRSSREGRLILEATVDVPQIAPATTPLALLPPAAVATQ